MNLQEQRISCLRMAIEMGCKADAVVAVATDLLNFITGKETTPSPAAEEVAADPIPAWGTALPSSETADLVLASAIQHPSSPEATVLSPEGTPPEATLATEVAVSSPTIVESATTISEATAEMASVNSTVSISPAAEPVPIEAALVTETNPATTPIEPVNEEMPPAASLETAPSAAAVEECRSVAAEAEVAATSPDPVAEAVVAEQATAVPAEPVSDEVATPKLDAEPIPAAVATNGAGKTEAASVAAPA